MLEKDVEAKVVKWAKENGWLTYKFTSPAQRSVPDRIFMQNGAVCFIEFKAPGKKPTARQAAEIQRIQAAGIHADWFDGAGEAIAWLIVLDRLYKGVEGM